MEKSRLNYIDQARGIGILLIVLGHVSYIYGNLSICGSYFKITIFYILSGYLTAKFAKEIHLKAKASALLIPYCVWSVAYIIHIIINGTDTVSIAVSLIEVVTGRGILTLWFLPSLFIAFVLHCYLKRIHTSAKILILIAVPIALTFVSGSSYFLNMQVSLSVGYFIYCIALTLLKGLVAFWFFEVSFLWFGKRGFHNAKWFVPIVLIVAGLLIAGVLHDMTIDLNWLIFGQYPLLYFVLGIMISLGIIYGLQKLDMQLSVLEFFGKNSLFIMCTHLPLNIVFLSRNMVSRIVAMPDVRGAEYNVYCLMVFVLVIIIEIVMVCIWNRVKPVVAKYKKIRFLRYI